MKGFRRLNNGEWNKPPVLAAARRILIDALSREYGVCELGEAADFLNGTSYSTSEICDFGKYPIIRISNITDPNSCYLRTNESLRDKFWICPGDLLVSWSASFKSIIWPGPEGFLNQHIFKVTEAEGYYRSYIRHVIEASFDEMQENVVGIGMMHLRRGDFLGHRIPSPPLDVQEAVGRFLDFIESGARNNEPALPIFLAEQRRVVARIEALAADIAEAKRLRQDAVAEAEAMLQGMASALAERNSTRKITIDELVGAGGLRNGKSVKSSPANSSPRCLTLSSMRNGRIDLSDSKPVPLSDREVETFAVRENDVFVVRGNGSKALCGRAGRAECAAPLTIFPDLFIRVDLPPDAIDPAFFTLVWNSRTTREIIEEKAKTTSGIWKINQGHILATSLPLPPLPEQRRIVAELDALQAQVDGLKRLQAETAAEFDALLPAILDRAFKGEL